MPAIFKQHPFPSKFFFLPIFVFGLFSFVSFAHASTISSYSPNSVMQGSTVTITVNGSGFTNFNPSSSVSCGIGPDDHFGTYVSSSQFTCTYSKTNYPFEQNVGTYEFWVWNDGSVIYDNPSGWTVTSSFNYTLSNSGGITATQGTSGSNTITATLSSGTTRAVSYSVSGLPSGATASFSQTSCNPTCSTTLTVATAASTPTGSSTITVTGTSSGIANKTTTFTLTVNAVPDTTPPAPPTVSLGSATQNSLTATWSGATDNVAVTGYRLDVSTSNTFGTFVSGYNNLDVGNITSRLISGLNSATTYYARVRAYDAAGNISSQSATASGATTAPPPPPNVSGYAWAGSGGDDGTQTNPGIGWIHLSGTATDGSPYGVLVSSASPGVLSGYAWANPNDAVGGTNNIGWIDFGPAGPYPVSSFVPAQSVRMDRTTGLVTGWARALAYSDAQAGGWDGWIGFGSGGNYTQSVTVSGCNWSGYAWGGGTTIGWIHFGGASYPVTGSGDGCAALPDLKPGAVPQISPVAGTATTFSSTITNQGTGPVSASFPNFFQVATAAGGGGTITDLTSSTMSALAPGASAPATSPSYTFPTAGTYSVRACANKTDRSTFGSVVESDYGNNCSGWTDITVASPQLSVTFSASSYAIDPGNSVMLTWISNADSCTGTGFSTGIGDPPNSTGSGVSTGPLPSNQTNSYPYLLTCKKTGYADATRSVSITIISVTTTISAKPSCISGGGNSKIYWSVLPVSQIQVGSCRLSGSGLSSSPLSVLPDGSAPNASPQTAVVPPGSKSIYTISCATTGGATVTKSASVDVRSCWTEF